MDKSFPDVFFPVMIVDKPSVSLPRINSTRSAHASATVRRSQGDTKPGEGWVRIVMAQAMECGFGRTSPLPSLQVNLSATTAGTRVEEW